MGALPARIRAFAKARRFPGLTMLTCDSTQSPFLAVPTKSTHGLVVIRGAVAVAHRDVRQRRDEPVVQGA